MSDKPTPDAYFAAIPNGLAAAAVGLRSLVLEAAPDIREVIKWGSPVYEGHKSVFWIKAHSKHLTFGFFRGSELPDPENLLEGTGKLMRHVKIRSVEATENRALLDLVHSALRLDG